LVDQILPLLAEHLDLLRVRCHGEPCIRLLQFQVQVVQLGA
jgi:hypothetical protein